MAQPLDTVAIGLFNSLTAGTNFEIPDIDVSGPDFDIPEGSDSDALKPIPKFTNADLTNATLVGNNVQGTGVMDVLMNTFMLHLDREYKTGHITGAEYTKAYIASIGVAASNGVAFLLQRDQAYWQGVTAQMQIINSRTQLAIAKTQLALEEINANTATVNYALTKAKLGSENASYISVSEQGETSRAQTLETRSDGSSVTGVIGLQKESIQKDNEIKDYNLTITLPAQTVLIEEQSDAARAQTKDTLADGSAVAGSVLLQNELLEQQYELGVKQIILVSEQGEAQRAQTMDTRSDGTPIDGTIFRQNTLLETQNQVVEKQVILVSEQGEAQRAQTQDTRSDGATVVGLLGKQKALYDQQITSYKRDAEVKAGKLWVDAWITMKTIDEGLLPPNQFTNTEVNEVLAALKTNNMLGSA